MFDAIALPHSKRFLDCWVIRFIPFVEKGLANFCRVDIINVGGFTETMKVRLLLVIGHLIVALNEYHINMSLLSLVCMHIRSRVGAKPTTLI